MPGGVGGAQLRLPPIPILRVSGSLWVASKMGLYQLQGEQLELRLEGDVHGISRLADGQLMASVKDIGAMQSRDGLSWNAWAGNAALLAAQGDVAKPYTIGKLVMDMHTGKAFFGKSGEWVWIDVLGFTLALHGLTGVWGWWQSRRRAAIPWRPGLLLYPQGAIAADKTCGIERLGCAMRTGCSL